VSLLNGNLAIPLWYRRQFAEILSDMRNTFFFARMSRALLRPAVSLQRDPDFLAIKLTPSSLPVSKETLSDSLESTRK